jgi:hypothetical protein
MRKANLMAGPIVAMLSVLVLLLGGAAIAQGCASAGAAGASDEAEARSTSGHVSECNVNLSSAIERPYPGGASADQGQIHRSSGAAGAPPTEGQPGLQSRPPQQQPLVNLSLPRCSMVLHFFCRSRPRSGNGFLPRARTPPQAEQSSFLLSTLRAPGASCRRTRVAAPQHLCRLLFR